MESQKLQSTAKIGLFIGSFDPVTRGHLDIILRASKLFDKLYVGIFDNPDKSYSFTINERSALLKENLLELQNVEVITHEKNLTVNIARELGTTALVRSVRSAHDFDYEANMIYFNREMTGIETILLVAKPELGMISSSRVKELAKFDIDISQYVPENVAQKLKLKTKLANERK
ncbi:MAG: pantetheine-phosphate adenylyltransferase [Streptococcaceae bacterium]|jgi:pantetheine-phosphate adenylyltransferase|nr:pantetheine-phosphate adenylyltransferase [Streptococcaceae bacterium]